ncbi:hypothetical protein EDD29_5053 [Actinocorallia herbida]|uniref:Uncharacterized protein n=1 Tax=Actinocorallia herbida TaxID=58109 RepID=A0A3N1D1P3_9ACTN|nr:hypothetical protein [Actinocorallia herbida]ROO87445.1 hypothetical protein EDD29_5053 [Actinocorallia herbida]
MCHATTAPPRPAETRALREALALLKARFPGALIWFGNATGHFWALTDDRLVEALTPADLARRLEAGRAAVSARQVAPPSWSAQALHPAYGR